MYEMRQFNSISNLFHFPYECILKCLSNTIQQTTIFISFGDDGHVFLNGLNASLHYCIVLGSLGNIKCSTLSNSYHNVNLGDEDFRFRIPEMPSLRKNPCYMEFLDAFQFMDKNNY